MNEELYDYKTNPDGVSGVYLDLKRRQMESDKEYWEDPYPAGYPKTTDMRGLKMLDLIYNLLLEMREECRERK